MAKPTDVVSHLSIKIGGQELPPTVHIKVLEVIVDQHAYLPAMFTIRLQDPALELLNQGPFDLATKVEIASPDQNNNPVTLIKGEVTALEPDFGEGMVAELVVRGYDSAHRLYRAIKSKTFLNVKDSDLAAQLAGAAGLKSDIEVTRTVYDHLYQHNQSDLSFLMQRAWRIGYECFVDDGKLVFRKPVVTEPQVKLAWGVDLMTFQPRMTLAEQVEEVRVHGWDVQKKAPIVGRADKGRLYPKLQTGENGGELTKSLGAGSKMVIVDQPVVSQAEADILAAARLDEISGVFIEAEGTAFRRPDIKAGKPIKLEGLGRRLSGAYLVTSATHSYTNEGFKTHFSARGSRTGLLTDQLVTRSHLDRWPGVAPAIVTNTDDPKQWGRVKVKYPWLSDQDESDWARVVSIGAGPEAGFCATPAVDDEVLVAFVHGDFGQPVVLGGVWNGKDAPSPTSAGAPAGEKPLVRSWHSRTGHHITMYDNADNKLVLTTKSGHAITLDDAKSRISIISKGKLEITLNDEGKEIQIKASGGKVTVKADTDVQVDATGNLQIRAGGNMQLEARGNLEMKANGTANLQATAKVAVQAAQISLG